MTKTWTTDTFQEACYDSGVKLHRLVDDTLVNGTSSHEHLFEPTPMHAALSAAGIVLRKDPGIPLAENPVPDEIIRAIPNEDLATLALSQMINDSLQPRSDGLQFTSGPAKAASSCAEAEAFFGTTIRQLRQPDRVFFGKEYPIDYQLLTDFKSGEPLALRKGLHAPTMLTIHPERSVVVNGVAYPPGSILSVQLKRERILGLSTTQGAFLGQELVRPREVRSLGFMRLSAYALPPNNRGDFIAARIIARDEPVSKQVFDSWSLKKIYAAAQVAVSGLMELPSKRRFVEIDD